MGGISFDGGGGDFGKNCRMGGCPPHDPPSHYGKTCLGNSFSNYEPELSYILAELLNMCLKESCFQIVGKSHR